MKEISNKLYQELEYLGIIDNSGVRNHNVGKSNYHTKLISPWVVWLSYPELTEFDKDIIKRILRTKEGDSRKMDYEKIIHICQERIRQIDCEEKYKKEVVSDKILNGDRFRCIKTLEKSYNHYCKSNFEAEFEYQSQRNGHITDNFGINIPFDNDSWKENFIRIKD